MRKLTTADLLTRLIGPVVPLGESHIDAVRLDNLKELVDVTDILIGEITQVASGKNSHMASVLAAAVFAADYLVSLHEATETAGH